MTVIDLSHPLSPDTPVWPGDPALNAAPYASMGSHGYAAQAWTLPGHAGTHLDAPAHVLAAGTDLASLPLSRCLGPGRVADVPGRGGIGLQHLPRDLAGVDFLLLRSGHDQHWGRPAYYTDFPRLTLEAAQFLAGSGLRGLGLDWPSLDGPDSAELPVHKILLGAGLVLVENLRGLERLPENFLFLALPLALAGGDGSPVRACALVEGR